MGRSGETVGRSGETVGRSGETVLGVWTPKIATATQPFLGLSDMRQGHILNSTGRQDCFLNS